MKEEEITFEELGKEEAQWVEETLKNMSTREKVGQLFIIEGYVKLQSVHTKIIEEIKPGGYLFRAGEEIDIISATVNAQNKSEIPMFLIASIEKGGNGIYTNGENYGNNMLISATGNSDYAYKVGKHGGIEARRHGINAVIDPIVDINYNYNSIDTNIRTFGDNPKQVLEMSQKFIKGVKDAQIATIIRGFPGNGVDGRNSNIVKTSNYLSYDEWEDSYGKMFKSLIEKGVDGIVVSATSLPSYISKAKENPSKDELFEASNMSKEILEGLLRKKLGYKGLIVSDSTTSSSVAGEGKRKEVLTRLINAGCDMLLFTKNDEEDIEYVVNAVESNEISQDRLNTAVKRILIAKARRGINTNDVIPKNIQHDAKECRVLSRSIAKEGITLVKAKKGLLPLSPKTKKKVLIIKLADNKKQDEEKLKLINQSLVKILERKGFMVTAEDVMSASYGVKNAKKRIEAQRKEVDVVIYISSVEPSNLRSTLKIKYNSLTGIDTPWFVKEIDTIFVSLGSPYHMKEVSNIETFINGYAFTDSVLKELGKKLIGESDFTGVSPVHENFDELGRQVRILALNSKEFENELEEGKKSFLPKTNNTKEEVIKIKKFDE